MFVRSLLREGEIVSEASDLYTRPTWQRRAACREMAPELFFPTLHGTAQLRAVEQAKAVCRGCPVVADCLTAALADPELVGVWGATSERERATMRRATA